MTAPYRLQAYNASTASENKIHDDSVAKQYGFSGGLVPGVDVYAYMTTPVVARWGLDWLKCGQFDVRLSKPVYDGKWVDVASGAVGADGIALTLSSDGVVCATGNARLPDGGSVQSTRTVSDFSSVTPPDMRPEASETSLAVGTALGIKPVVLTRDVQRRHLDDVREPNDLYVRDGVAHPGWLLRAANSALKDMVVLGPWVHVGSNVINYDVLRVGEELSARGAVVANHEKKGHRFVDLDVLLLAGRTRPVTRIRHVAIWQMAARG